MKTKEEIEKKIKKQLDLLSMWRSNFSQWPDMYNLAELSTVRDTIKILEWVLMEDKYD